MVRGLRRVITLTIILGCELLIVLFGFDYDMVSLFLDNFLQINVLSNCNFVNYWERQHTSLGMEVITWMARRVGWGVYTSATASCADHDNTGGGSRQCVMFQHHGVIDTAVTGVLMSTGKSLTIFFSQ